MSPDHVILIAPVQLHEIRAPAPDPHDQAGVVFRMRLRVEKGVAADGVELELMAALLKEYLGI